MLFDFVSTAIPDPIFGKLAAFHKDPRTHKINLMLGVYKNEELKSELMPAVKAAKHRILARDEAADYLPLDGMQAFHRSIGSLVFGPSIWTTEQGRIYSGQTIGGTGALRAGAEFLIQGLNRSVALPQPSWANHKTIFERAGYKVEWLPYYDPIHHQLTVEKYLDALASLTPKTVVLLHAACHNPTGNDLSMEHWRQISRICKEKALFPFFDFAYQGFGTGIVEDAAAVRLFLEEGHEMLIAYSCSKNFSLYCQRVGTLFAVCPSEQVKSKVETHIPLIFRASYSNPPAHGARIAAEVLQDPALFMQWEEELSQMRQRIVSLRQNLLQKLVAGGGKEFSFIAKHKGMFSYLDLNDHQVKKLLDEHAIYMLDKGRISVAGLNQKNIDSVVAALLAVIGS